MRLILLWSHPSCGIVGGSGSTRNMRYLRIVPSMTDGRLHQLAPAGMERESESRMRTHHQRSIERVTKCFVNKPEYLALIIGGSIAMGYEKEDSDVDVILVATDEEYERRKTKNDFFFYSAELCTYEGGYVDGKVVDLRFLREVEAKGSEPARAAFRGAMVAFSHLPELEALIRRIPVYPEAERRDKIQSFHTQFSAAYWFFQEAQKRSDPYLVAHAAHEMVFYASRLMLAHNRILYPYHKWLMREVGNAPQKPEQFVTLAYQLLRRPEAEKAKQFFDCIDRFTTWEPPPEGWVNRFYRDVEWTWRNGRLAVADR